MYSTEITTFTFRCLDKMESVFSNLQLTKIHLFNKTCDKMTTVGMVFEKYDGASRDPKGVERFQINQNLTELSRVLPWHAMTRQLHNLLP